MELKPDYKLTGAGVIPEDWDAPNLGDILTFRNGLNKAKAYFGYGTPIVNYMDVYKQRSLFSRDLKGRVTVNAQEIRAFDVRKGDVFFTRTSETAAEVGLTAVMLDEPTDAVFSGFVLRGRPKDQSLEDTYKKYCFSTTAVRKQITSRSSETTRALTSGRSLSAVVIARPGKLEQHAIAAALSAADALIESLEQLIAKKRQIKQGAMHELLTGKRRLPGLGGEWGTRSMAELGATYGGMSGKSRRDFGHGTARYITFMNIMANVMIDTETFELVEISPKESQNRVALGDLFFNGSSETPNEVGLCSVLRQRVDDVYLNSFCIGFRLHRPDLTDGLYLAYFFRSQPGRQLMRTLSQGAIRYNLSKSALLALTFPMPGHSEQIAITSVLSDMDAEIATLGTRLAKARQVKQGMMQELLTGRTRLI